MSKQVENPLRNWREMNGRSNLERQINAYLSHSLMPNQTVSNRQFTPIAYAIKTLVGTHYAENRREEIYTILVNAEVPMAPGATAETHHQRLSELSEALFLILALYSWPDMIYGGPIMAAPETADE